MLASKALGYAVWRLDLVLQNKKNRSVRDLGNFKCERHTQQNVEIEFNGQKYVGPFEPFTYKISFPYKNGECQKEMNDNGFGADRRRANLSNQSGLSVAISVRSVEGNCFQLSRPSSIFFESLDQR